MDELCRRAMSKSMVIGDGIEASVSRTRIRHEIASSDGKLGLAERTLSAAGAAFLSAILMNPLDVAKVYIYICKYVCVIFTLIMYFPFSLHLFGICTLFLPISVVILLSALLLWCSVC